jgi:hypothetical protein
MPPSEDQLLPARAVRDRYGRVSDMWLWRRLRDDPTFPRPTLIAKRRFWRLSALVEWERMLAARGQGAAA